MKSNPEIKRQTILDIACRIFARFGFAKTTLDDIADAVGMKKGSLYYYFASKEAIFSAVVHQFALQVKEKMQADIARQKTTRGAILKLIESGIRHSYEATNVIGLTVQIKLEVLPLAEQILKDFHEEIIGDLSAIIKNGIDAGDFKPCDTNRIAWSIHTVAQGIEWNALHNSSARRQEDIDIESVIEETLFVVGLMLDGLRSPVTAKPSLS